MDSPNKRKLGNGIRTRSSRDSSVDDSTEENLKGCTLGVGDVKKASGVSTRHHTRRGDPELGNGRNVGLEFPMGRRRRKFPKIITPANAPPKVVGARTEDAGTKQPRKPLPSVEKPHTRNGDRKKSTATSDAVFQRRSFGQRRRRRSSVGKNCLPHLASCEIELQCQPATVSGSSEKNAQCDGKGSGEEHSSLENSSLDGTDPCDKEDPDSGASQSAADGTPNCTAAPKVNSQGLPKHGKRTDGDVLQERKRIRSSENVPIAPLPDDQDGGLEECAPDEQSLTGTLSNDCDSRDSTEQYNRSKDQSSAHEPDSDDGSVATTDSRSSAGRQRRKSDTGNGNRTGIDFRVGGRLEARDYLNMWYPSRIIQVDWDDKEVLIHFERWNSRFDEWVSMDSPRLRAITRTSTRKEKKDCPFPVPNVGWADLMRPYNTYRGIVKSLKNEYKVGEVILAKWTDCKMYPAKIVKINSDLSYNVLFYDGFERLVQYINIKKLPVDFSGDLSFKDSPSKVDMKRRRSTSGSKKEEDSVKDEEKDKTKVQSSKNKGESNKSSLEKDSVSGEKQRSKSVNSPPVSSNHKGNGTVMPIKRRKLLVGGIFQAKRHQLAMKIGGQGKTPEKAKNDIKAPRGNKKLEVNPSEKIANEKETMAISPSISNLTEPIFAKANDSLATGFAPSKAFVIEEDHNHFKCLVEGCGKAFRKDVLLASHIKHYHTIKRKKNMDKPVEKKQEPLENTLPEENQPGEPVSQTVKNEANLERKLITEKRRQRLLQKKLDKQFNEAAAAAAVQQQILQPAKQSKRTQGPSEVKEENVENALVSKLPVKSERPKSRKRKYYLTARGVVAKLKRRRLEGEAKTKTADGDFSQQNLAASGAESEINPHLEPVSSKMFLKLKRKQRFDPILSSDESEKSTTTSTCDSTETCEDKALIAKLRRDFGVYRSGHNVMGSSWGGNCELRDEVVNCRCQVQEEDGLMMQCEVCLAWQHGACFDIEDEDKVPEKYICFACDNPKGQRQSFRHKHNQDWFKLGELATFRFLPKRDTWSLKDNMLKTHNLASQLISVGNVLHALQCQLQIAKEPKHSNLVLWAHPWQDASSSLGSSAAKMSSHLSFGSPESGQNGSWMFGDHSYSVPNRAFSQNEMADHSCAFLAEHCDDKTLCFDVAANEELDPQGMGPPLQEEIVETSVSTDPKLKTPTDCSGKSETNDSGLTESVSEAGTPVTDNLLVPKEELGHHNHSGGIKEEKDEHLYCPTSTQSADKEAQICSPKTPALDKQKLKERRIFFPPNSKKSITETFDVYSCQLNLMDHIEHLQGELDHRLDELNQQLEFLECDFESPCLSSSDDTLADIPRVKKLLKTIGNDLVKVQRMALYC